MRRLGQAAGHSFRVLRVVLAVLLGLAALLAAGIGFLAWRLSQGPIDLPWAAQRLEQAVNAEGGPTRLEIDGAALAWEGFRRGVDAPVDIRLTGVRVVGPGGAVLAAVPHAGVALALGALLIGRVVPRAVELDRPRLSIVRGANGAVTLDLGSLGGGPGGGAKAAPARAAAGAPLDRVLGELAAPPHPGGTAVAGPLHLGELRRVLISDAQVTVIDRAARLTWHAPSARIELRRGTQGGIDGTMAASLLVGRVQARLNLRAVMAPGGDSTLVEAHLSPVTPADLAQILPALAPLGRMDAPVALALDLALNRRLGLRHFAVAAQSGPGRVRLGTGEAGLIGAELLVEGTPEHAVLHRLRIRMRDAVGDGPGPTITMTGEATRGQGRFRAHAVVGVDQVNMADLALFWPEGVGGGGRAWVTQNITAGTAHDGRVELTMQGREDLSRFALTGLTAQVTGTDLTVHWLRPLPPMQHVGVRLTVDHPDALVVSAEGGGQQGPLSLRGGSVTVSGLTGRRQYADIDLRIGGPLAAAVTLLRSPRLHLLEHAPVPIRDPAGTLAAELKLRLPLIDRLTFDQVALHATAKLAEVHLSGVAAGRDLDDGSLALDVTNDGLKLAGDATLAGIPAALTVGVDFNGGPKQGVVTRVTAKGSANAAALKAAGFDTMGVLSGPAALALTYSGRRDGSATLAVQAGLTGATLRAPRWLGWSKPAGKPADASARVALADGQISSVEAIDVTGPDLSVQGRAGFTDGRLRTLHLDHAVIGQSDASGDITFPQDKGEGLRIDLSGRQADLSTLISAKGGKKEPEKRGIPWTLTARFRRVLLAHGSGLGPVSATAQSDGLVVRRADIRTGPPESIHAVIAPEGTDRRLSVTAADAGALLSALDLIHSIRGGRTSISAIYHDGMPGRPLSGTAEIDGARMIGAPAAVRVLEAMSLYGLATALRGPGLDITRLIAPFRLDGDVLRLDQARAFNSALGVTAKGTIDTASDRAALEGTIVPVYAINSFLGRLPVIGQLFSPEKGGGVFSATYHVSGPLKDPTVVVNPLAALTPGFLRGLFGIFGH